MKKNNRVDNSENDENNDSFEIKNKELLENLNTHLKLNYFTNDQAKHIDYVIYYNEDILENDKNTRHNRKIKHNEEVRDKFLNQITTQEGFEIQRIVKKNENDKVENYLLLHCSLNRLMQEGERMQLVLPLRNVFLNFIDVEALNLIKFETSIFDVFAAKLSPNVYPSLNILKYQSSFVVNKEIYLILRL